MKLEKVYNMKKDSNDDDVNKIVDIGNIYPNKSLDFDYDLDVACNSVEEQEPHTIIIKAGDKIIGKASSDKNT